MGKPPRAKAGLGKGSGYAHDNGGGSARRHRRRAVFRSKRGLKVYDI
jgi:hypothetical protein